MCTRNPHTRTYFLYRGKVLQKIKAVIASHLGYLGIIVIGQCAIVVYYFTFFLVLQLYTLLTFEVLMKLLCQIVVVRIIPIIGNPSSTQKLLIKFQIFFFIHQELYSKF